MSAISTERPVTRSRLWSGRPMRRRWPLTIVGVLIIMVMLFPLYYTLVASLQPSSTFLANTPGLIPTHPVFSNFSVAASTIGPTSWTALSWQLAWSCSRWLYPSRPLMGWPGSATKC